MTTKTVAAALAVLMIGIGLAHADPLKGEVSKLDERFNELAKESGSPVRIAKIDCGTDVRTACNYKASTGEDFSLIASSDDGTTIADLRLIISPTNNSQTVTDVIALAAIEHQGDALQSFVIRVPEPAATTEEWEAQVAEKRDGIKH
jgi:hypothetical protein